MAYVIVVLMFIICFCRSVDLGRSLSLSLSLLFPLLFPPTISVKTQTCTHAFPLLLTLVQSLDSVALLFFFLKSPKSSEILCMQSSSPVGAFTGVLGLALALFALYHWRGELYQSLWRQYHAIPHHTTRAMA